MALFADLASRRTRSPRLAHGTPLYAMSGGGSRVHLPMLVRTSSQRPARPDPGSLIPQALTPGHPTIANPRERAKPLALLDGTPLDSRIVGGAGCTISGRTCGTG